MYHARAELDTCNNRGEFLTLITNLSVIEYSCVTCHAPMVVSCALRNRLSVNLVNG